MKQKCRFLIGQILLFILNHFLTIKRNKIKNRKTGEKLNVAKFIGFYVQVDLAQTTEIVEFARSGRRPRDNDSTVTTVSELENNPEHKNFNFISKCKFFDTFLRKILQCQQPNRYVLRFFRKFFSVS